MPTRKGQGILKMVEVGGSPYDMGFQYGATCPEIREMLAETRRMFGGPDKAAAVIRDYVPKYLPAVETYAPEILEELKGMAAGAGVMLEDIMFLNITYEISTPSVMGGCTAFAAAGGATANGAVLAGQNFDYIEPWSKYLIALKMSPANGPAFLAVTAAGCLGLFGLNSAGITLNLNLLKDKNSLTATGGVPTHVILRKILSCESIAEAIAAIASAVGRAAKNYLVTDEQGDIIDIETTTTDLDIQYPERGILTHANHFKADRFKSADLASLFIPDAYVRSYRLYQLMEDQHGKLTVESMQRLLQDHNNHPGAVCRHCNPRAPLEIGRLMKTLISIVSCPAQRKAWISVGNPCESRYFEYSL
jgi:isopenicillin-N N-acyltransferase-like protein